jgi:tRNA A37 threonylcarbamoyladenosine modification protein TsaB
MKILGLTTSGKTLSVAVTDNEKILSEKTFEADRSHSIMLLPTIKECLKAAGLEAADLNGIAVDVGPGSYTGIRIGIATAMGLAFGMTKSRTSGSGNNSSNENNSSGNNSNNENNSSGNNSNNENNSSGNNSNNENNSGIPVCGVSSLEAMAYGHKKAIAIKPARGNLFYAAVFENGERITPDRLVETDSITSDYPDFEIIRDTNFSEANLCFSAKNFRPASELRAAYLEPTKAEKELAEK